MPSNAPGVRAIRFNSACPCQDLKFDSSTGSATKLRGRPGAPQMQALRLDLFVTGVRRVRLDVLGHVVEVFCKLVAAWSVARAVEQRLANAPRVPRETRRALEVDAVLDHPSCSARSTPETLNTLNSCCRKPRPTLESVTKTGGREKRS